jgi:hypothetical protein
VVASSALLLTLRHPVREPSRFAFGHPVLTHLFVQTGTLQGPLPFGARNGVLPE